jgi:hypothetical protein
MFREKLGGDQLAGFQVSIVGGMKSNDVLDVSDSIDTISRAASS